MRALEPEGGALTLRQVAVPTAAVAERRRRRVAAGHRYVPTAADVGRLVETELDRPAADGPRAVVGDRHVQLIAAAPDAGRSHGTTVRTKCLTGQQHTGQQHSELKEHFH